MRQGLALLHIGSQSLDSAFQATHAGKGDKLAFGARHGHIQHAQILAHSSQAALSLNHFQRQGWIIKIPLLLVALGCQSQLRMQQHFAGQILHIVLAPGACQNAHREFQPLGVVHTHNFDCVLVCNDHRRAVRFAVAADHTVHIAQKRSQSQSAVLVETPGNGKKCLHILLPLLSVAQSANIRKQTLVPNQAANKRLNRHGHRQFFVKRQILSQRSTARATTVVRVEHGGIEPTVTGSQLDLCQLIFRSAVNGRGQHCQKRNILHGVVNHLQIRKQQLNFAILKQAGGVVADHRNMQILQCLGIISGVGAHAAH